MGDEGIFVMAGGQKMTQNNRGREMSVPTPLLEEWVGGYDGVHPIADVGAAYGRNVGEALARGIPIVAVDCCEAHLKHIRQTLGHDPLLKGVLYGMLPRDLPAALKGTVSSVLVAEVLHFMQADEMDDALRSLWDILIPGGRLCLTICHYTAAARLYFDDPAAIVAQIEVRAAAGDPWPGSGLVNLDSLRAADEQAGLSQAALETGAPTVFHCHTGPAVEAGLRRAGFEVLTSKIGNHPGYPAEWQAPDLSLQIIARKQ